MLTIFQFIAFIVAVAVVIGSTAVEVLITLAVCFAFNSCDFNFDWESYKSYFHPNTSELAVKAISYVLPVLPVLHVLLAATCFLFISATTIYALVTVLEFFFVAAKRVLVYILKGRHMLSQLSQRPTQPVVVDAHNLLQLEQQDDAPPVTSSILRSAGQKRPHNRHVKFSATHDTTCVYLKGLSCPLVEQETIVFHGASKLRDSSRRDIMAHYGMCRISQTYGTRHVGFDPAVEFTGRVTLEPLLEMPIGILQPVLEEEEAEPEHGVEDMEVEPIREETPTVDATPRPFKRSRSTDDTDADLAHEQKSSKRVCLRAASQEHRRKKRKCSTTATTEMDATLEREPKRARICADASQVKSEVAEVSRFIIVLISYFFVVSILSSLNVISLWYILLLDPSHTIISRRLSLLLLPRLSLLLRTSHSRQPTIPSSRMSSPRKHPLNSSYEKKWRLRLRHHSSVGWLFSQLLSAMSA